MPGRIQSGRIRAKVLVSHTATTGPWPFPFLQATDRRAESTAPDDFSLPSRLREQPPPHTKPPDEIRHQTASSQDRHDDRKCGANRHPKREHASARKPRVICRTTAIDSSFAPSAAAGSPTRPPVPFAEYGVSDLIRATPAVVETRMAKRLDRANKKLQPCIRQGPNVLQQMEKMTARTARTLERANRRHPMPHDGCPRPNRTYRGYALG